MFLLTVRCLAIPWADGRKIQHDLLLDGLAQRRPAQRFAFCAKGGQKATTPRVGAPAGILLGAVERPSLNATYQTSNLNCYGKASCAPHRGQQPDRHPRQEGRQPDRHLVTGRLVVDLALRQRLLQFGDTRVGDLGVSETEPRQFDQSFEVDQTCVGNFGVIEVERL